MTHDRDFTDTTGISEGDQIFALIDRYAARASRRGPTAGSNVRILTPEQRARLMDLSFSDEPMSRRGALEQYAVAIASVMHTPVAFVDGRGRRATVIASSADTALTTALEVSGDSHPLVNALSARRTGRPDDADVFVWREGNAEWTVVPLHAGRGAIALVIHGEWSLSSPLLRRLARTIEAAVFAPRHTAIPQGLRRAHRLARVLARVGGVEQVCRTALEHIVRAVPSRSAVFAVPDADGMLSIAATYGYPRSLVGHIRIARGADVLGAVYASRAPMHVVNTDLLPAGRARRPQYLGKSFIAIPALAGQDVLGVLSVTERVASGPYTRGDLSTIRALMAPTSLALAREGARQDAEAMAQAAVIDPVSGLFNRRYFQARLEEELQPARRVKPTVGLLMIDIDNFKHVNDSHGHIAGDAVIRGVAAVLRDAVRASDITTRYGGEEFAVLMPRSDARNARSTAERIRARIEEYRLEAAHLPSLSITVSVGVATSSQATTAGQLIAQADAALYRAKREGRNRVCSADEPGPVS